VSDGFDRARRERSDVTAARRTDGRREAWIERVRRARVGLALLAVILLVPRSSLAQEHGWTMDAATSRLGFTAIVERSALAGAFREFEGRIRLDSERPAASRLDVTVAMKSADMNDAELNRTLRGAEWFDVDRFPRAEFHATGIQQTAPGRYLAHGILRLKGVQQPVEVPFTWVQMGDAAKMEGELVIPRGAFGIGTGQWAATTLVGPDVKVGISVRLRRDG
jgi:polyisoprenoid-binding protein YceI